MSVELVYQLLLWCTVINMGMIMWWALMFMFAHDWMYRYHGKWFKISVEQFDSIHYGGIAFYKILVFVFNFVPLCALLVVLR